MFFSRCEAWAGMQAGIGRALQMHGIRMATRSAGSKSEFVAALKHIIRVVQGQEQPGNSQ